jgi:RNA polymerase sigma-70 factor (ECF subfamily)
MTDTEDTDVLVQRVADGDETAVSELLDRHRQRLRRMVAIRLDDRVSARVDPSDVVQETLIHAVKRLPEYARNRPIPFYPWLRQQAWEQVVRIHRRHISYQNRSVKREQLQTECLSGESQSLLADRFAEIQTSASGAVMQHELKSKISTALGRLTSAHREILVLIFLERLTLTEAAAVLGVSAEAARSRQRRALDHFGKLLRPYLEGSEP